MDRFRLLFPRRARGNLICMLHLPALPGAPMARMSPADVAARACAEAEKFLRVMGGAVDGFLVENMGDLPYLKGGRRCVGGGGRGREELTKKKFLILISNSGKGLPDPKVILKCI